MLTDLSASERIEIRVVAVDPPGNCYGADRPLLLGVQCRSDVEQIAPATATASFGLSATLTRAGTGYDILGPYVHGKKGDRFFYLSWGCATYEAPFEMFARAKLKLGDVGTDLLDRLLGGAESPRLRLVCSMAATNEKGHPASGSIRPPNVQWTTERAE